HLYADDNPAGTSSDAYTIGVSIADDDLASVSDAQTIVVADVAPTPQFLSFVDHGTEGVQLFMIGGSTDPAGSKDPRVLSWNVFKEGSTSPFASGTGPTFKFTPDNDGQFRVELTATDDDGVSGTISQMVTIANAPPTAGPVSKGTNEDIAANILLLGTD